MSFNKYIYHIEMYNIYISLEDPSQFPLLVGSQFCDLYQDWFCCFVNIFK